jgi:hypothetical protein
VAELGSLGVNPHVHTILYIKDGFLRNVGTIIFLLGLSVFSAWIGVRSNIDVFTTSIVWAGCAFWILFCMVPLKAILRPKSRLLAIDGDDLVWQIRDGRSKTLNEQRIPWRSVRALEFVVARRRGLRDPRGHPFADLRFISLQGAHELPPGFFPGFHRKKIIAEIRRYLPAVQVNDKFDDSD